MNRSWNGPCMPNLQLWRTNLLFFKCYLIFKRKLMSLWCYIVEKHPDQNRKEHSLTAIIISASKTSNREKSHANWLRSALGLCTVHSLCTTFWIVCANEQYWILFQVCLLPETPTHLLVGFWLLMWWCKSWNSFSLSCFQNKQTKTTNFRTFLRYFKSPHLYLVFLGFKT